MIATFLITPQFPLDKSDEMWYCVVGKTKGVIPIAKRRPNGDGMIRKRADGRWEGRITVGHKANGKPIYKNVLANTQSELLPKLNALKETYAGVELTEDSHMTLGKWLDKWLNEYVTFTVRESTLEAYRDLANNQIKRFIGDKQLSALKTVDIQKLYNKVKNAGRVHEHPTLGYTLSDTMVRKVHMLLHQALDAAVREHLIPNNPTNGTTIPKCNYAEKQILCDSHLDTFLEAIKEEKYWCDFFYTEIMTGLRRGEICGLKWSDLNMHTGDLNISRQVVKVKGKTTISTLKTKSSIRTVRLAKEMVELLAEIKETAKHEWMFPSPVKENAPRDPSAVYRRFQLMLERANCKKVRFHDLRHTFATMAIENGMDVKTLSAMIGHVSAEITLDIYSHITDTMQQQAAVKIDREIGGTNAEMADMSESDVSTDEEQENATEVKFEPYKGKIRKPGTGCISMINEHLYEGRYSPKVNGKRMARNVYADTREECEEKLAELIREMKAELAEMKKAANA